MPVAMHLSQTRVIGGIGDKIRIKIGKLQIGCANPNNQSCNHCDLTEVEEHAPSELQTAVQSGALCPWGTLGPSASKPALQPAAQQMLGTRNDGGPAIQPGAQM